MYDKVNEIKACFMDLLGDMNNKDIIKKIEEKTKELIYANGKLEISIELKNAFENNEMDIGVLNNTNNVPDQYIIYVSYKDKVGVEVEKLSKADLIDE